MGRQQLAGEGDQKVHGGPERKTWSFKNGNRSEPGSEAQEADSL